MSQQLSFNLVDEAWIPCIQADGMPLELNLRQVLAQAHQLSALAGDSPPVTASILRFLLAILHRVFGPEDEETWVELWEADTWDMSRLNAYLNEWQQRFELFDPQHPFYQAPDKRVKTKSTISLSHDRASGNNPTLFDHHTEEIGETLTPAQAARILLAGQSYGLAGLSGIPQKFTDGTCAGGTLFLVEGDNLKETLLLNMIQYPPEDYFENIHTPEDRPAWEMDDPFSPERAHPLGYLDYLTWQNRRVLFQPEQAAEGVIVRKMSMGPALRYDPSILDPMKNYRIHEKLGPLAISFSENRTFWRDSAALFAFGGDLAGKAVPPATLKWLRYLVEEMGLPGKHQIYRTLAMGMSKKQAKVYFFRQEQLPLPMAYLTDERLVEKLDTALANAGTVDFDLLQSLRLVGMYLKLPKVEEMKWHQQWSGLNQNARGDIDDWIAHTGAQQDFWTSLDIPFQAFVVALAEDAESALKDWHHQLQTSALEAFERAAGCTSNDARSFKAVVSGRGYMNYRLSEVFSNE